MVKCTRGAEISCFPLTRSKLEVLCKNNPKTLTLSPKTNSYHLYDYKKTPTPLILSHAPSVFSLQPQHITNNITFYS